MFCGLRRRTAAILMSCGLISGVLGGCVAAPPGGPWDQVYTGDPVPGVYYDPLYGDDAANPYVPGYIYNYPYLAFGSAGAIFGGGYLYGRYHHWRGGPGFGRGHFAGGRGGGGFRGSGGRFHGGWHR